jgi:two-component system chemotaxis response regulator CheY
MTYQFRNASILVVDDMEPMLALVTSLLDIFGFKKIYRAADAEEGLKLFLEHRPDLVLIDWQMEPYDGIELARRMRADPRSPNRFVPIIMMTGYSHKIRVEEARDAGITEFLVKPFKAKDLYARIEMLIEKPRRFVEAETFFGPDRRRRRSEEQEYKGSKRRELDEGEGDGDGDGEEK